MKRLGSALLILVVLALPASADEFNSVVKGIESHYGIHRTHPHLINFALFFAKPIMWGSGVGGLKVAVFEDFQRQFSPSMQELDQIMLSSLGPNWKPFVRVDSRKKGETTVVYGDFSDRHIRLLVASIERNDVAVVHMTIDGERMQRWASDTKEEAKSASHPH